LKEESIALDILEDQVFVLLLQSVVVVVLLLDCVEDDFVAVVDLLCQ
jgi:hypothetical protein